MSDKIINLAGGRQLKDPPPSDQLAPRVGISPATAPLYVFARLRSETRGAFQEHSVAGPSLYQWLAHGPRLQSTLLL